MQRQKDNALGSSIEFYAKMLQLMKCDLFALGTPVRVLASPSMTPVFHLAPSLFPGVKFRAPLGSRTQTSDLSDQRPAERALER